MRRFLIESLAVLCVHGWPVHVLSARNREKRLWFGSKSAPSWNVTIVCLRHNSIHHSHRVPVPSAFRNPWIFASSWFNLGSFLLLREFHKLQGKINLFFSKSFVHQRLIREVFTIWSFCDAWCLNGIFYHIAAGTNLTNETNQSNKMSPTWHKWTETSHFTQSKVTISPTLSNEISRSNETSRCTRLPCRELSTVTYCGHTSNNWTELLHLHSDPLRSQRK